MPSNYFEDPSVARLVMLEDRFAEVFIPSTFLGIVRVPGWSLRTHPTHERFGRAWNRYAPHFEIVDVPSGVAVVRASTVA